MAGFDWEYQRSAQMPNLKLNTGTFDFSSGTATYELPTTLAKAMGGMAIADLSAVTDTQQTFIAYKVGEISNGAVTFLRGGVHIDEDAHMSYVLWGF